MASQQIPARTDATVHNFEPSQAADVAAALVEEEAFLSALIGRDMEQNLLGGGKRNRTVDVSIPSALVAHSRDIDDKTTGLILDEIAESTVSLTLGTHAFSAVSLSEDDLNYKIGDFSRQVLRPQGEGVADFIEHMVERTFADIAESADAAEIAWDEADPVKTFTAIRKALRKRGVPQKNLNVVVGTNVYGALLDAGAITDASQSASTAALREGNVGKIRGFNIVESLRVGDDEIVAFHRDAFTMAVRAPKVPQGAPAGALSSAGGFPLRWLRDYDTAHQADLSVLSTFTGIAQMPLYRVERDYTAETAQVVEVPEGAVMKVDTASAPAAA